MKSIRFKIEYLPDTKEYLVSQVSGVQKSFSDLVTLSSWIRSQIRTKKVS